MEMRASKGDEPRVAVCLAAGGGPGILGALLRPAMIE